MPLRAAAPCCSAINTFADACEVAFPTASLPRARARRAPRCHPSAPARRARRRRPARRRRRTWPSSPPQRARGPWRLLPVAWHPAQGVRPAGVLYAPPNQWSGIPEKSGSGHGPDAGCTIGV
eukprot:gene2555-biopygen1997